MSNAHITSVAVFRENFWILKFEFFVIFTSQIISLVIVLQQSKNIEAILSSQAVQKHRLTPRGTKFCESRVHSVNFSVLLQQPCIGPGTQ